MPLTPRLRTPLPVRVVLSTPAVLSFVSVWKAAALSIAQLGAGLFFVAGVAAPVLGPYTVWAVLATAVIGWFARAIDIESWALLIPGGTASRVQQAFGPRAGRVAAAVAVVDRTVFAALAAVVTGQYVALVLAPRLRGTVAGAVAGQELATVIGVAIIGLLWMRTRIGLSWPRDAVARGVWAAVVLLIALTAWAVASLSRPALPFTALWQPPALPQWSLFGVLQALVVGWSALLLTLPAIGGGDALSRVAHEFAPPRLASLRRMRMLVGLVTASLGHRRHALLRAARAASGARGMDQHAVGRPRVSPDGAGLGAEHVRDRAGRGGGVAAGPWHLPLDGRRRGAAAAALDRGRAARRPRGAAPAPGDARAGHRHHGGRHGVRDPPGGRPRGVAGPGVCGDDRGLPADQDRRARPPPRRPQGRAVSSAVQLSRPRPRSSTRPGRHRGGTWWCGAGSAHARRRSGRRRGRAPRVDRAGAAHHRAHRRAGNARRARTGVRRPQRRARVTGTTGHAAGVRAGARAQPARARSCGRGAENRPAIATSSS